MAISRKKKGTAAAMYLDFIRERHPTAHAGQFEARLADRVSVSFNQANEVGSAKVERR
jgi:hypothetical protein